MANITAYPDEGWEFDKWAGDIAFLNRNSNPTTITIDSDKSIICNFQEVSTQVSTQTKFECRFYPNPVNDNLIIELQNEFSQMAVIQLFDNTGRLILKKKIKGSIIYWKWGIYPRVYI